jgi:ubiquinone/menaquinone biosynthesis C-methylase UbiE
MNKLHLEYCAGPEWGRLVRESIVPWVTDGVDLGDHLLEVGPGPGLTTDVLRERVPQLTAVEVDPMLAAALRVRLADTNVTVVDGDATALPFEPASFSAAICLTMLHHVPEAAQQDRLIAEMARVVQPGGIVVGTDNLDSPEFRQAHIDDICNPIDPATLAGRLAAVGLANVEVTTNPYAFRFRVRV